MLPGPADAFRPAPPGLAQLGEVSLGQRVQVTAGLDEQPRSPVLHSAPGRGASAGRCRSRQGSRAAAVDSRLRIPYSMAPGGVTYLTKECHERPVPSLTRHRRRLDRGLPLPDRPLRRRRNVHVHPPRAHLAADDPARIPRPDELGAHPQPCGRTDPRFPRGLYGRLGEMLHIRGKSLYPTEIDSALRGFREYGGEHRIVVTRTGSIDETLVRVEHAATDASEPSDDGVPRARGSRSPTCRGIAGQRPSCRGPHY